MASLAAARPLRSAPAAARAADADWRRRLLLLLAGVLAAGATWLLRRHGSAPLLLYFAAANVAGLAVTAGLKLA